MNRPVSSSPLRTSIVVLTLSPVIALLLSATPSAQDAPSTAPRAEERPAGNAEKGKRLFNTLGCYECHGYQAQGAAAGGGFSAGRRLAPSPMPFRRFAQYVRAPRVMPPYSEKAASEQDLADIYAFLLTVPQPPDLNSIPLLAPSQFSTPKSAK